MTIHERLLALRDEKNAAFLARLIPNLPPETVLGARTPELRSLARELRGTEEAARFLETLPHGYLEENQLHAFLIAEIRDYARCLREVERFLPFVDNWATCDGLRPKVFRKHRAELIEQVKRWIASGETYTVRFGLGMLMTHYLDADFRPEYLDWAASVRSEEYYVRMMVAWYFATALAKQYEAALPVIEQRRLDPWTHNKTIQKAAESFRVPEEHKTVLQTLRVSK